MTSATSLSSSLIGKYHEDIEYIYCFTGLKLHVNHKNDGKVYLVPTQKTKIIGLDIKFYEEYVENMEKSIAFNYSYLTMPIPNNTLTPETLE